MNVVTLEETQPFEYKIIEGRGQTKRKGVLMCLEGTLQRANTKNANGRIYPTPLWQGIMDNDEVNERMSQRRMLGELDHPASGSTSLSRVSHVITEHQLLPDGRVIGKLDILETPAGKVAATLFEAGVQLGISSRGDGSVERKGDVDEVQTDYRLETYDLVLKPSTPGAYPRIVESEEKAKENINLIASAVEGLVNNTDDVNVLLECHKIISVLEGCESRCESAMTTIRDKLGGKADPPASDDGGGSEEQPTEPEVKEMKTQNVPAQSDTPPGVTLSPEMRDFLQEWVNKGVAEAVAKKDREIAALNARIVEMTGTIGENEKKLTAAEELIEEFTRKVKELSENQTTDIELKGRYDAAVRLLDEAVNRLQKFGDTRRRLEAAEELLSASITRHQAENIERHVDRVMAELDLDEETDAKVRGLLEGCETAREIDQKLEMVSSLMEKSLPEPPNREPLPATRTTNIDESTHGQPATIGGDIFTSRLLARLN